MRVTAPTLLARGGLTLSGSALGEAEQAPVRDVSFSHRAGEIVGIYGLLGAGRTELLRMPSGAHAGDAGNDFSARAPSPTEIDRGRSGGAASIWYPKTASGMG